MKWAAGLWGLRMLSLGGLRADVSPAPPPRRPIPHAHRTHGRTDAELGSPRCPPLRDSFPLIAGGLLPEAGAEKALGPLLQRAGVLSLVPVMSIALC